MDMRTRINFPRPPSTKEEIYDPKAKPWMLACSLVGSYTSLQYNTYRKLWVELGDSEFRDVLDVTRVILSESSAIRNPAAFLASQLYATLATGGL